MNGKTMRMERRRDAKLSRLLVIAAALVLFAGLFTQIAMRAQIARQSKEIAAMQSEIKALSANAENLGLTINQRHNLEVIDRKAKELGMTQPSEDQVRVLNLPALNGDTSTQTVANTDGEERNG